MWNYINELFQKFSICSLQLHKFGNFSKHSTINAKQLESFIQIEFLEFHSDIHIFFITFYIKDRSKLFIFNTAAICGQNRMRYMHTKRIQLHCNNNGCFYCLQDAYIHGNLQYGSENIHQTVRCDMSIECVLALSITIRANTCYFKGSATIRRKRKTNSKIPSSLKSLCVFAHTSYHSIRYT